MSKPTIIGMWISTSQKGGTYLSGKDKASGIRYFVFSDKDDSAKKKLCKAEDGQDITTIGVLEQRSGEFGDFMTCGNFIVSEHRFYDEADPYLKRKDGSYITNKDGEKIGHPEYQLKIKA